MRVLYRACFQYLYSADLRMQQQHPYIINKARPGDAPTLIEIWEDSVRATHPFVADEDVLYFKELIVGDRVFERMLVHVLRVGDGTIAGFMAANDGMLDMLFLAPAHIGKGGGRLLMEYALTHLGVNRVDVNEQNADALAFYRHFGFEVTSRSPVDGFGKPYPILHMALQS